MSDLRMIQGSEYSDLKCCADGQFPTERFMRWLGDKDDSGDPEECARRLGVACDAPAKASHFVGQVWVPGETPLVLRVHPKEDASVDYFAMFLECMEYPEMWPYLWKHCFWFWPEEAPISWDQETSPIITMLLVASYLRVLSALCRRHLRRYSLAKEENLCSKVKGRILIKENLRTNEFRGRLDRAFCRFRVHSLNRLENQILKAALHQSTRYLAQYRPDREHQSNRLWGWASDAATVLAEVELKKIAPLDFRGMHYAGFMQAYRIPHKLAKAILTVLGWDPNSDPRNPANHPIAPYAIDMNELFERYCEGKLRNEVEGKAIWVGYQDNNLGNALKVRPDFLCFEKENRLILDAKYKPVYQVNLPKKKYNGEIRSDIFQVLAYSRHKGVQKQFHEKPIAGLRILYPEWNDSGTYTGILEPDKGSQYDLQDDLEIPMQFTKIPLPKRTRTKP